MFERIRSLGSPKLKPKLKKSLQPWLSYAVLTLMLPPAVFLAVEGLAIQAADFALGGGTGRASGNARTDPNGGDASPQLGGTLLLTAGFDILHYQSAAIGLEVPLALHGSRSSDVFARGGFASFYTERLTAVLTPGVRVRFATERRLSPWFSFGAGLAVIRRTGLDFAFSQPGASQNSSSRTMALTPAAGIDVRVARHWFFRGELRNYLYRTPSTGFVSSFPFWNRCGRTRSFFSISGTSNLDLAPDGKRFAVLALPETGHGEKSSVHVVFLQNFFDELRRRIPAR